MSDDGWNQVIEELLWLRREMALARDDIREIAQRISSIEAMIQEMRTDGTLPPLRS